MAAPLTLGPVAAVVVAGLGLSLGAASLASAAPVAAGTCHGLPVTIAKHSGHIIGTAGRDVIRLTGPGHVRSGGGSDIICGSRYADRIEAGAGDDVVLAGRGNDRVSGGPGRDIIFGEGGNDVMHGGPGRDILHGGAGRNRVVARNPVRAGEMGIAAVTVGGSRGDVVTSGTRAVSVIMDDASAQALALTDQGIVTSWVPTAFEASGFAPAWQVFRPMLSNAVAVGDGAAAFWAANTMFVPGVTLDPGQMVQVTWGSSIPFGVDAFGGGGFASPGQGQPGTIAISSGAAVPMNAYVGGVALQGSANGRSQMNTAVAAGLLPNYLLSITPPTALQVRVGPAYTQEGQLLAPATGSQFTNVTFSASRPTATLVYDVNSGFRAG